MTDRVHKVLETALGLFGPNGEFWAQGAKDNSKQCIITALWDAADTLVHREGNIVALAMRRLAPWPNKEISHWNDDPARTWQDVKTLFEDALGLEAV